MSLFPDVEAWAVAYLDTALADRTEDYAGDVTVATVVPKPRADRMVIVRRDGGNRLDVAREEPRLGIRVWASDDIEAVNLTNLVRALIFDAAGDGPVRRVREVGGPVSIPDESGQPQRLFTVALICRGQQLS